MDTTEVADLIGTTPRTLRQFLRSPMSTFVAVGSGARYDFSSNDVPTLKRRFTEWQGAGKPRPDSEKKSKAKATGNGSRPKADVQRERDEAEWAEEGPVVLADIRDPRVRARVKAAAQAAEDRLMLRLMAAGLHITQLGDRKSA
jgi:hypothetical protein